MKGLGVRILDEELRFCGRSVQCMEMCSPRHSKFLLYLISNDRNTKNHFYIPSQPRKHKNSTSDILLKPKTKLGSAGILVTKTQLLRWLPCLHKNQFFISVLVDLLIVLYVDTHHVKQFKNVDINSYIALHIINVRIHGNDVLPDIHIVRLDQIILMRNHKVHTHN